MATHRAFTDGQLEAALRSSAGLLSIAAEKLSVTRQAVHNRVRGKKAAKWTALLAEIEDTLGDLTESQVVSLIRERDAPTVRWYADRKLKHRGYGPPNANTTLENAPGSAAQAPDITGPDADL